MSCWGWIGIDFDGTLAEYDPTRSLFELGPPIPAMVERVKKMLDDRVGAIEVRIFTARVAQSEQINADGIADNAEFVAKQRQLIQAWCEEHLGQPLHITATKDFLCVAIYDDRCHPVEFNTGRLLLDPERK